MAELAELAEIAATGGWVGWIVLVPIALCCGLPLLLLVLMGKQDKPDKRGGPFDLD